MLAFLSSLFPSSPRPPLGGLKIAFLLYVVLIKQQAKDQFDVLLTSFSNKLRCGNERI